MADKVRFGLRNAKYAIYDSSTKTYGTPVDFPGAVSLSMTREGGDSSDFYADDGIYYTFAGTNGGYSLDLEMARITDTVRVALLGETVDETTGVQYEDTEVKNIEFAIIFETQTNDQPVGFVFYNCVASRPELNANTLTDSPDVDTDTLNIRASAREVTISGAKKSLVQSHILKTADNTAKYTAFFASVVIPGDLSA